MMSEVRQNVELLAQLCDLTRWVAAVISRSRERRGQHQRADHFDRDLLELLKLATAGGFER